MQKNVQDKDKAVQYDLCELWIHIQCNNLNYSDYRYLQNCAAQLFLSIPYIATKTSWLVVLTLNSNITQWKDLENDNDSSLLLKPSSNLELLVNQFNNATPENGNDPQKIVSFKYYDIDEMHNIEIPDKSKPLSLFYVNACSLSKNFDDLQHILSCNKFFFT